MANEEKKQKGTITIISKKHTQTAEDITWNTTKGNITLTSAKSVKMYGKDGGVVLGEYTPPKLTKNVTSLKKFLVHFRRPSGYKGEFGFDWLRDEYIYPITSVGGTMKELSLDIPKLKTEYKTTDVLNPIAPYTKEYYCSFLNLMLNQEVELDIEVEELEALSLTDATEIIFESSNPKLTITPTSIPLNTLIAGGKTNPKNLDGTTKTRDYYLATNQVKVKCDGVAFIRNEQIKVFAKLKNNTTGMEEKVEVGKMMVMKNSDQLKYTINIYVIKAFISDNPLFSEAVIDAKITSKGGLQAYEDYLNQQSLNQGLIQVKLIDKDSSGNILKMPLSTNSFNSANRGINPNGSGNNDDYTELQGIITNHTIFEVDSGKSVNFFNLQFRKLYTNIANQKCILLYLCPLATKDAGGSSYTIPLNNKHCIIFGSNLGDFISYAHEIGHTLGLEHTFLSKDSSCNLINLNNEKNNINRDITNYRTQIDALKRQVDTQWNEYNRANSAYFTQYPNKIPEYKKPYDDNKSKLDDAMREYKKKKDDEIGLIDKNNIRFIRAFTENIMDYWGDDTNCDGTIDITGITHKLTYNKYQWKIIEEEAKLYYH